MQVSFDETLLGHEQIWAQYRGLHSGERYQYERGNVRSMQAAVTFGHLIERAYRDGEASAVAQAAADAELLAPVPQGLPTLTPNMIGALPR